MLPSELLHHRPQGDTLVPQYIPLDPKHLALATAAIALFQAAQGECQATLNQTLQAWEGDDTDYRLKRGFAHILRQTFSTFAVVSPLDPIALRQRVFTLAATQVPSPATCDRVIQAIAAELSQTSDREVSPLAVQQGLYADLRDQHILTTFDAPTPETLIHRYNLAQVQGLFYKASHIVLNVHRNDPGEYKLLFRYLKLFRLMTYVEGDADHGFTITIDGPNSLFKPSTRYGLDIAKLIPALLHVTRWNLTATLQVKETYTKKTRAKRYTLAAGCNLVSHYPPGKPYDSMLEAAFADRWAKTQTDWQLEREVELIPLPGSVMIPDFRLVHPTGTTYLLEIVGYWRPEYLRKKFAQVEKSNCSNLILAISERLNLEQAGVRLTAIPTQVIWFKDKLTPQAVLAILPPQ